MARRPTRTTASDVVCLSSAMNTKVKSVLFILLISSLCQGVVCLPGLPQSQEFPSERLDEAQDPTVYEKDFNQEQKRFQNELPRQNGETDYWQRHESRQLRLMREREIDGTGPGEVISQKSSQDTIDQTDQIHCLTHQSNKLRGNGLTESSRQINQGGLPRDLGQGEEITDGYADDTYLVESKDAWENCKFRQMNTNSDPQRSDASKSTSQNASLKWDRSNGVKDKKTEREALSEIPYGTSSKNIDWDKWSYDRNETNITNDLSEVVEVQKRGLKKWGFKTKKSRKGKTIPVTKNSSNKFWNKFNRKGNMVVRGKSLSSHDTSKGTWKKWNDKYGTKSKKVFKKSKKNGQNKFDRGQNKSEKTVQEYGNDDEKLDNRISANDPESKSSQLDGRDKWDRGATDSRKTDDLEDTPPIQDHPEVFKKGNNEGRTDGKIENNPTEKDSRRDAWKKWDRGEINSGKMEEAPIFQDNKGEAWKKWDEERNDGSIKNSGIDDVKQRDAWKKLDRDRIGANSGKTETGSALQGNQEEAWKEWDEEKTDGNIEKTQTDDDSRRNAWKKWDRGEINSGKAEEAPIFQDNQGEAWKKWDEERNDGSIKNSGIDDVKQRDAWKKWDRDRIGANSGKTETGSALQGNQEEAWKEWDEEKTDGNIEKTQTDDDSRRNAWKKWDRGEINSGKAEEAPIFQDNQGEAWKKWDEERNDGSIKNSGIDDVKQRDAWKKWDRDRIGANSGKTETGSALQGNQEEAWKEWDEEKTDGNIENSQTDDNSRRDAWKKWDRGAIHSGQN